MTRKNIVFTAPKTAECLNAAVPEVTGHNVLVRMEYTVVSGGTPSNLATVASDAWSG